MYFIFLNNYFVAFLGSWLGCQVPCQDRGVQRLLSSVLGRSPALSAGRNWNGACEHAFFSTLAEGPDLFTLLISHVSIFNVMPSKLFSVPFTRRHVLLSAEGEQHLDNSLSFNWSARGSLSFRVTRDGQPKLKKEKIHTMLPARHGMAGKTSSVKCLVSR